MTRDLPEIRWRAVLAGGAVAVLVSVVLSFGSAAGGLDRLAFLAVPVALGAGGATAGRLAGAAGPFQGGLVAVLWILAEALSASCGPVVGQPADPLADLALTVVADAGLLAIGSAAGWVGERSARL